MEKPGRYEVSATLCQAKKTLWVEEKVNSLDSLLADLHHLVGNLSERLSPVKVDCLKIAPNVYPPQTGCEVPPPPSMSPLAVQLGGMVDRARDIKVALQDLENGLDV